MHVFPWGRRGKRAEEPEHEEEPADGVHYDPLRAATCFKTAWNHVRKESEVSIRFHDLRHTCITKLAESGAGDETIRAIAGHVSQRMLRHYSHIRTEAKRSALESIATPKPIAPPAQSNVDTAVVTVH
jgi:integrase